MTPEHDARDQIDLMVPFGSVACTEAFCSLISRPLAISITTYSSRGLFTTDIFLLSALLGPLFIVAMAAGAWMFRDSAEETYRRIAYLITAISAVLALPLFDEIFR